MNTMGCTVTGISANRDQITIRGRYDGAQGATPPKLSVFEFAPYEPDPQRDLLPVPRGHSER
jgi:hypothetical protein